MEPRLREVRRLPHHEQESLCTTRAAYRQGRQLTAVKVYTVNDESQHIIVSGVPALGLQDDLRRLCRRFGDIKSLTFIPNYTSENFVEGYHVHYARIQSARFAKRHIDGRNFYGGTLHVCYAPEMESISETRHKLLQRHHDVLKRCRSYETPKILNTSEIRDGQRDKASRLQQKSCVWNGKAMPHDPRALFPAEALEKASSSNYGPQPFRADWKDVGVREVTVIPRTPQDKSPIALASKTAVSKKFAMPFPSSLGAKPEVELHSVRRDVSTQSKSLSPILRLVPSQVKGVHKKIVFHSKAQMEEDQSCGNVSLDSTIKSVREKIRAVGVPNVKILLNREVKIPSAAYK